MTTIHHAHQRTSPSHLKRTTIRAPRPTALPRVLSSPRIPGRAGKTKAVESSVVRDNNDEDDMASSFLQYCAMCERQILIPNNSILYCSESCRRKDSTQTSTLSIFPSPFPSTTDMLSSPTLPLVPRRHPTYPPILSSIPPDLHNAKPDPDPTEWKPDLPSRSTSSDAFAYLSQFHRSAPTLAPRHPGMQGRSATSLLTTRTTRTTPSLSHTPTTSTSSEGSEAGTPVEFGGVMAVGKEGEEAGAGMKGLGLVKPVLSAVSVEGMTGSGGKAVEKAGGKDEMAKGLLYEKQVVDAGMQRLDGSLKRLLGMRELGTQ